MDQEPRRTSWDRPVSDARSRAGALARRSLLNSGISSALLSPFHPPLVVSRTSLVFSAFLPLSLFLFSRPRRRHLCSGSRASSLPSPSAASPGGVLAVTPKRHPLRTVTRMRARHASFELDASQAEAQKDEARARRREQGTESNEAAMRAVEWLAFIARQRESVQRMRYMVWGFETKEETKNGPRGRKGDERNDALRAVQDGST